MLGDIDILYKVESRVEYMFFVFILFLREMRKLGMGFIC